MTFGRREMPQRKPMAWPGPQSFAKTIEISFPRVILKRHTVRDRAFLRAIASLPCSNCKIEGYSQAAHPPPTGKGIKESDPECFPLCCTRPGITGCHVECDQYRLIPKALMREQAAIWNAEARKLLS